MAHGYELVSGAIVSRVEKQLAGNNARETWDRTEKAMLLGRETGADAIVEIRALYIDEAATHYLKESEDTGFKKVSQQYADERAEMKVASRYELPFWEARVEMRIVSVDGAVLWQGGHSIQTSDVLPESWVITLYDDYPDARETESNFDYDMYYRDDQLKMEQLYDIIDALLARMPKPRPVVSTEAQ